MYFQVSRDCCQEKWKRDFSLHTQFLWWSESLTKQNPHPTYYAHRSCGFWPFYYSLCICEEALGCVLWHTCGIGSSGLEACSVKVSELGLIVSFRLLFLYHLFSRVSRDKSPFPSLQVFARYGNCMWDTICPSGLNPLSLQRSPITLLALTSTVTPCHALPTHFLPFLFSFSPLLSVWPHHYSP